MKRLLLIIGLVVLGIAGNVYADEDEVLESIRHELGLDRCHEEQVRSAAPDPIINDETCKRTICEGNFWGSSCTDVCCNGEERTVGEGDSRTTYEICYMRRCSRTNADDVWVEVPRETSTPPPEPYSDNSIFERDKNKYSQSLWDILVSDALADVVIGEPDVVFTFMSSNEKSLIVNELNYALENMSSARDEWGPSSEYNLIGRDASELRSYFFLTLKLLREARKVLMPELYCDIRYDTYCFSGVAVGWGEHNEAGVDDALGVARGTDIQLATEFRINLNPGMARAASIIFIHELTHSFGCYQGWFLRCDQNGNRLPLGGNEEWKWFHNESTAYIIESIYTYFLLLDNRGGGGTGDTETEIFTSPEVGTRSPFIIPEAYAMHFEMYMEDSLDVFQYLLDDRGATARRVIAAFSSLAMSFRATDNPLFRDWFEEQLSHAGVSVSDLGIPLLLHFNLSPTAILDVWENQFQAAGGIFRLWPACSEYIHGPPTGEVAEGHRACLGLPSDTNPDLAHDTMASPETGPATAENVEGEPPSEEEYSSWDEPEDPSRVSSSEEEDVAESEGGTGAVMPQACAGYERFPLNENLPPECAQYCSRPSRLRNAICSNMVGGSCYSRPYSSDLPTYCTAYCSQLENPLGPSNGGTCRDICINDPQDWCTRGCERDPFLPGCVDICRANSNFDFCIDICEPNPAQERFCGMICNGVAVRGESNYPRFCQQLCLNNYSIMEGWRTQTTCLGMCNLPPRGSYPFCSRYCTGSSQPDWCLPEDTGTGSDSSGADGGSSGGRGGDTGRSGDGDGAGDDGGDRCSSGWVRRYDSLEISHGGCYPYIGQVRCCGVNCEPDGLNEACHPDGWCGCLTDPPQPQTYYCARPHLYGWDDFANRYQFQEALWTCNMEFIGGTGENCYCYTRGCWSRIECPEGFTSLAQCFRYFDCGY